MKGRRDSEALQIRDKCRTAGIRQRKDLAAALGDLPPREKISPHLAVHTLESWQQGRLQQQYRQQQLQHKAVSNLRLALQRRTVAVDPVAASLGAVAAAVANDNNDSSSSQESDPLEAVASAYEKLQEQLEERREEEQQQAVAAAHLRFPL